ncbi:MAG: WHG domain-containing protein [Chloroflexota bacterium]|nr:WHG domain-containing protein [Dehalococcoidia bacterium]MDW8253252.1 WHG domain-containing protein [Chloroflexota bacterium]
MPRARLDTATVIRAAAELADERGLDGVSFTALAARLGVRGPSLYHHVAGPAALRRAIASLAFTELADRLSRATIGKARDEAVYALAEAFRDYVRAHPGRYAATVPAPPPEDRELARASREVLRVVLAVLAGYGISGPDAVHATRQLRAAMHGFATLESAGAFGAPIDFDESFRRLIATVIAGALRPAAGSSSLS